MTVVAIVALCLSVVSVLIAMVAMSWALEANGMMKYKGKSDGGIASGNADDVRDI